MYDPHQKKREADAAFWSGFNGGHSHRYSPEHINGSQCAGRDPNTSQPIHQPPQHNKPPVNSGSFTMGHFIYLLVVGIGGYCVITLGNPF